ncbi:MAG: GGDEF and EAL domain-containing protein [Lachnospiraceae bacterium]|nr:GGDEF and EAL domain-containing protein [Lachnospiraceae bacterium]
MNNPEINNEVKYIPNGLPGGIFIYRADGNEDILYADQNVIDLFDCHSINEFRELTNNSFKGMVFEDDLEKVENGIQSQTMFGEKRHDYVRYRIKTKKGVIKYIEDFGHLMHGADGHSYFYVFIIDVNQDEFFNRNKNSYAEAQVLSLNYENDPLTGLFNMTHFYHNVQDLIAIPEKQSNLSIIYMDIMNFKLFNERYGFQKGDELLFKIARVLWKVYPDHQIARFSDDHFVICTSSENIEEKITSVHDSVLNIEEGTKVELRTGIYTIEDNCKDVGLACDHARLACNSIKKRYDVYHIFYDSGLRDKLKKQQYVIDHLDQAIENEYLQVFYQPVIRVSTGKICGYEALARWKDPKLGMLSPFDFIDTLEQFHLIHKLDLFMVRKVCEDYKSLSAAGEPTVPVSINLSRLDFQLCNIYDKVNSILTSMEVPLSMLDIEITESALNENAEFMKEEIRRFHDNGYQIWIDDFGSGYSSLNVLVEYVFDVLKLDMKFLRSFDQNPRTGALINYIVQAAKEMGIQTLAEGVETKNHFEFLKKIGCNKAQGYLFSKPLPMAEVREATRQAGLEWEIAEV